MRHLGQMQRHCLFERFLFERRLDEERKSDNCLAQRVLVGQGEHDCADDGAEQEYNLPHSENSTRQTRLSNTSSVILFE